MTAATSQAEHDATQAAIAGISAGGDATLANQTTIISKIDVIDGIVDSILIDTNDLQLNQGNWLTATGFNTVTPMTAATSQAEHDATQAAIAGIVAGGDATLAKQNTIIADIAAMQVDVDSILIDTDDLQLNQGNWLTATGFNTVVPMTAATSQAEHDATQAAIAGISAGGDATLANQTTIISKIDVIDGIVDSILIDTNDLQLNQGNWLTATGFNTVAPDNTQGAAVIAHGDGAGAWDGISGLTASDIYAYFVDLSREDAFKADISGLATEANATSNKNAIIAEVDANEVKIDLIETKAEADARQVLLIAEHDATQVDIGNLNDFDPAVDVVARVTLVDTTTANADMRGTDGANTVVPLAAATDQAEHDATQAAISGLSFGDATLAKQNEIIGDIAALNNISVAEVWAFILSGEVTSGTASKVLQDTLINAIKAKMLSA